MSDPIESPGRREFLGYTAATALIVTRFANVWAAETGAPSAAVTEHALKELAEAVDGELLLPSDPRFEPIRNIGWNVMVPPRKPDLIVRVATQKDVVRTLAFARAQNRRVVVRGGGHSWCASAVRNGGVMLDLGRLNTVSVDPVSATASVGPAVRGTDLLRELAPHGFAFPVAYCPTVPLGGFLLNGGIGINYNRWGSACSNIRAIDLVLADGRELTISSEEHSDLFWAARGAGPGFFAVATRFHLSLRPLPRALTMSTLVFPPSEISTACQLIDDLSARMSRDVQLVLGLTSASDTATNSKSVSAYVLGVAFVDTSEQAAAELAPLNDDPRVKKASSSTINVPSDLNGLHGAVGAALPGGHRYIADNIWSNQPLAKILDGMADVYAAAPSTVSNIMVPCFHPDFSLDGTAHSMWGRNLVYQYAIWTDPATDTENEGWHADVMALLDPHMVGRYVGEADLTRSQDSARECYASEAWKRLRTLRKTYDPDGLFFDYLGMG